MFYLIHISSKEYFGWLYDYHEEWQQQHDKIHKIALSKFLGHTWYCRKDGMLSRQNNLKHQLVYDCIRHLYTFQLSFWVHNNLWNKQIKAFAATFFEKTVHQKLTVFYTVIFNYILTVSVCTLILKIFINLGQLLHIVRQMYQEI